MKSPGHEMILASAGSGKTFALTNRFVQLLALGAAPERIVALTFTRKAAGEFFDEILKKLARASTDAPFAGRIADETGTPLSPATALPLLRAVVDAMPRLALGTYDSFFSRIVRSFPLELGLGGDFEVLQDHSARVERQRVLRQLFTHTGAAPSTAQRNFIEAFKRATFGLEEKNLTACLDRFLDEHAEVFLAAPVSSLWGNAARIWPGGCPWLGATDVARAAGTFRALVMQRTDFNDKQRVRLDDFFLQLPDWQPGATLPKPVEYLLKNTLDVWEQVLAGAAEITIDRRKVTMSSAECSALALLVCAIVGGEINRRLEITRGIFAVIEGYDRLYNDTVRRAGRLTFADIQRLLEGVDLSSATSDVPGGSSERTAADSATAERRLLLDWRLDGQFDHWLLDEFQDTSHGQWRVLRNLIDEVVQDASGQRTFFYVGDVKQAIYAWREGDSRLFREIFNHYNAAGAGAIGERRLDQSRRSGPAVLAMVNRVFGDAASLVSLFPAEAAERWSRDWREHTSAIPEPGGHAAWIHAADMNESFAHTLGILREVRPLDRGLTVAVLVQKNEIAAQLADYLRGTGGLPAVAESDLHVCTDNPLTAALLALFKLAAHPGDSLAREHVRMTPLHAELAEANAISSDTITGQVLSSLHERGFEATIETWLSRLDRYLAPDDIFSRERGRHMVEAARLYDETGGRDVAEFIQFMERHTVREAETAAVIRVMTVHKAKGLGFDLVILPDLDGDRLAVRRGGLAVQKSRDRAVEWIFDLPPRIFCEHDEILSAHIAAAEAEGCYEKLALLYVAMTRARRATYIVARPSASSSKSNNFARLLTTTLGDEAIEITVGSLRLTGGFSSGDPAWFASIDAGIATDSVPSPVALPVAARHHAARLPVRTPSDLKRGRISGASLFAETGHDASAFGRSVHAALAAIEWWSAAARQSWRSAQRAAGISDEALAEAEACVSATTLAEVFAPHSRPTPELWRERAFEIVIDQTWVTGVFDRVHVFRDAAGRATRAVIYDFKTDRHLRDPREAALRYTGQMTLYRHAVAKLAGLPEANVAIAIVFTHARNSSGELLAPIGL